jgi:hypothetical protein
MKKLKILFVLLFCILILKKWAGKTVVASSVEDVREEIRNLPSFMIAGENGKPAIRPATFDGTAFERNAFGADMGEGLLAIYKEKINELEKKHRNTFIIGANGSRELEKIEVAKREIAK